MPNVPLPNIGIDEDTFRRQVVNYLRLTEVDSVTSDLDSIEAYGAVGDGGTDNSIALQRALDGANGIYIPEGTYSFSTQLNIDHPILVVGLGSTSILDYTGSATAIVVEGASADHSLFSNFALTGPGSGGSAIGFDIQKDGSSNAGRNINMSQMWIQDFQYGLKTIRTFSSSFQNCYFLNCGVNLTDAGQLLTFVNCWWRNIPLNAYGVVTDPTTTIKRLSFIGCNFSSREIGGYGIQMSADGFYIGQCNFEDFYTSGQSASPDRDAIHLHTNWGRGTIEQCSFGDCQAAIKLTAVPLNSLSTVYLRGSRLTSTSVLVNENNISRTEESQIIVQDKWGQYDEWDTTQFTNQDEVVATHSMDFARSGAVVRTTTGSGDKYKTYQIAGFHGTKIMPTVLPCSADDTTRMAVLGIAVNSATGATKAFPLITDGPVHTGKDQSAWTIGSPAYLQDDGSIGNSPGTYIVPVGRIVDQGNPGRIWLDPDVRIYKSGTATVANGTTTATITHGFPTTPGAEDIIITPTNGLGNASQFWVSNVGATTFDIEVDSDPGATTATFGWKVVVP